MRKSQRTPPDRETSGNGLRVIWQRTGTGWMVVKVEVRDYHAACNAYRNMIEEELTNGLPDEQLPGYGEVTL